MLKVLRYDLCGEGRERVIEKDGEQMTTRERLTYFNSYRPTSLSSFTRIHRDTSDSLHPLVIQPKNFCSKLHPCRRSKESTVSGIQKFILISPSYVLIFSLESSSLQTSQGSLIVSIRLLLEKSGQDN